jgi:tRNA A58 N-methylase Trm61
MSSSRDFTNQVELKSDIIHVKGLLLDMPHYSSLIERLAVILRPGGMLVLIEAEPNYVS